MNPTDAPHPAATPLVSVVIPALNAESTIERCLRAALAQRTPFPFEVLLVDNGSTDRTAAIAHSMATVRVLSEPRRGAARARNAGCRAAGGRYFAFTDSDCEPHPDWLADLVPALEADPNLGGIGGHIVAGETENLVAKYIDWRHLFKAERAFWDVRFSPPFFMTANAIYRREAFEQAGGFDENLWPSEDADLSWRIAWNGWRLEQCPDRGVVVHHHRTTMRGFARMMYLYGIGGADLFAKHRGRFGARLWIDWQSYWRLAKALLKIPVCPLLFRDPVQRRRGIFDTVNYACFLAGRWRATIRNRVIAL